MAHDKQLSPDILLREPHPEEGVAIFDLIRASPPLDVNSVYCYHLLTRHFAGTCVVASRLNRLVGCITAYLRPDRADTLFVWQVAVAADQRGQGLARRMLASLLAREVCRGAVYLETTVTPSNQPSRRSFARFAGNHGYALQEVPFLAAHHFGAAAQHEAECLLRIGPISPHPTHASA